MGITASTVSVLVYAGQHGVSCATTMMLGRQQLFVDQSEAAALAGKTGLNMNALPVDGGYAEPLFTMLGATAVHSMDYSAFEGATHIHDLNKPVGPDVINKYSLVFDGGTLEHVFNFPVAIRNCMMMVAPGGHFVAVTPANNHCGHGFYQFSPELFFSLFRPENGFTVSLLAVSADAAAGEKTNWFEVKDPHETRTRVTLSNTRPTSMLVIARRTGDVPHELLPFQSDYQNFWNQHRSSADETIAGDAGGWRHYYRKLVPRVLRDVIYKARVRNESSEITDLGFGNPRHYRHVDI